MFLIAVVVAAVGSAICAIVFVIIASVVFTHCVFDVGCDVYVLFILLLLSLVFLQFSWV